MTYANCAAAYADGRADIPAGDPAYAKKLDRDGDSIACESADAPAGFTPKPAPTSTSTIAVEQGNGQGDQLPQTGPGSVLLAGLIVAAIGVLIVAFVRRRKSRFVA